MKLTEVNIKKIVDKDKKYFEFEKNLNEKKKSTGDGKNKNRAEEIIRSGEEFVL